VPDSNSNVVIPSGKSVIINSNVTVSQLQVQQGASVTVSSGFKLNVLH